MDRSWCLLTTGAFSSTPSSAASRVEACWISTLGWLACGVRRLAVTSRS